MMLRLCVFTYVVFTLCACSSIQPKVVTSQSELTIAEQAQRTMQAYATTGMVLSVLEPNKPPVILAFGKANQHTGEAVTTDTLFPIASISKAFTTTALAILVDRGQLEWDAPLQRYIPEFAMYDPWVSQHFTVRDALTHRSGLPLGAGDLLFWPDGAPSSTDILKALPYMKPSSAFRSEFAYDNLLYVIAGELVQRISGQSWADFVTTELFEPIGLNQCAADVSRIKPEQKVVTGHERSPSDKQGIPIDQAMLFAPSMAAAAGIYCTAADMLVWGKFWLDGATTKEGKPLLSEQQRQQVWAGVTPLAPQQLLVDTDASHYAMYALGWFVQDFQGTRMISHSGGAPGVVSNLILLPDRGIVLFASNNDYFGAPQAITLQLANQLLGQQQHDYIAMLGKNFQRGLEKAKARLEDVQTIVPDTQAASVPLADYAGVYADPWYGTVTISLRGEGLYIDMSRSRLLDGPLRHYQGDEFLAIWPNRTLNADAKLMFKLEAGKVLGFTMQAISAITDFSYDFHDLNFSKLN
jgi:CubicO group peptidase (beta-lactamase class C family)